ncbi:MAG: FAD binding domain-containing protein [Rhodospirillales bacterium]|nr:FAD binding domain-containing protein [Rhodospirillales bacterium]
MHRFTYRRPASLAEAKAMMAAAADGRLLAGGQTLIPILKQRLAQPSDLVDIGRLAVLKGITVDGGRVTIGAVTTHAEVAAAPEIRRAVPALAALAEGIGDAQVRNRGTIGGSIANADPAADWPAAVVALDATIRTDRRDIAADAFFTGLMETALEADEIVTAISFPIPDTAAYLKFPNPASRYAVVGVMVARTTAKIRLAVTGAGPLVFRVPEMERALARSFTPAALDGLAIPAEGLNEDIHASPEYRAHLVGVMARRAVAACGTS